MQVPEFDPISASCSPSMAELECEWKKQYKETTSSCADKKHTDRSRGQFGRELRLLLCLSFHGPVTS